MTESYSTSIEDKIFDCFGFEFNHERDISSYKDVLDSITLGPVFKRICKNLALDPAVLSGLITRHVLHLISEDIIASVTVTYEDKVLYDEYCHLWSDEQNTSGDDEEFIGHITDEYFNDPREFVEYYDNFFEDSNTKLDGLLAEGASSIWRDNSRKSGSLYRVVLAGGELPLSRQPVRIKDNHQFFHNAVKKTRWFLETLEKQMPDHCPIQELVEFEKGTSMLFLMQASLFIAAAHGKSNEYKYSSNAMRILSSFILIDDPGIRSYFNTLFYCGSGLSIRLLYRDGYDYFFLLFFVYLPCLVKYVKRELSSLVRPDAINEIRKENLEPCRKSKLITLYENDFIYKLVKNPAATRVTPYIKTLEYIDKPEHLHRIQDHFMELYRAVYRMERKINEHITTDENFAKLIKSKPLTWCEEHSQAVHEDVEGAIEYLATRMAEDFTSLLGLSFTEPEMENYL